MKTSDDIIVLIDWACETIREKQMFGLESEFKAALSREMRAKGVLLDCKEYILELEKKIEELEKNMEENKEVREFAREVVCLPINNPDYANLGKALVTTICAHKETSEKILNQLNNETST
jgi:hypothetical protein